MGLIYAKTNIHYYHNTRYKGMMGVVEEIRTNQWREKDYSIVSVDGGM